MVLVKETIERFGYDPSSLTKASKKLVIRRCDDCGVTDERRMQAVRALCRSCASLKAVAALNDQARAAGLSPKGLLLGKNREKERERGRRFRRKERATLRGKVINRIRVAIRLALNGEGQVGMLPYGRQELVGHIEKELIRYKHKCPLCGISLKENFNIDHRIPVSTAKSVEDVIDLFKLENLSVLCPPCNQYKKGVRLLEY